MGNGQSTSQRIEQIIENYTEANGIANARSDCLQNITVIARNADIINCNGGRIEQQCSAMSNADLDTVVAALQSATLDSESQQVAEGLALAMNVSVTDNEMISKTLNKLVANCQSNTNNVMESVNHLDISGALIDCTGNPNANVFHFTQYGSAEATCVVRQIVDAQQDNYSKSNTYQENKGFKLPDFGAACLGVIALMMIAPALMPRGKNKNKNNY